MDKAKKKRIKKYITWAALAAVVALLAAMPLLAQQEAKADGPVASVLSAEVKTGSLSASIHGGGNLEAETIEEIKLPSGVKITEFLVKNGQFVTAGTPVATVDKVSVMTAITEVTETLEYLQEKLEDARSEKVSASIKAAPGGRVKKLFARAGESVQDVMLRDGALALLSLDGRMAVKLERKLDIRTGEAVTVTLADGKEITGRVESNLDGVVVITVEDKGYEIGQNVIVTTEDGDRLGSGQLYVHNAWKATAYTGTIETVNAKEEQTLSEGATLYTVKDRDFDGELRRRANQHREYQELLQELFQMYESGTLTAPCDGEVEGVEDDSVHLLSAVPEGWVIAPLSSTTTEGGTKGYFVMKLSNAETLCTGVTETCQLTDKDPAKHKDACIKRCTHFEGCTARTHYADCTERCDTTANCTAETHKKNCITLCTKADSLDKCTAVRHYSACIHSCSYGTQKEACDGTKHHALGCIESCKEGDGGKKLCNATGEHKRTCIKSCIEADIPGKCPATKYHSADCVEQCSGSMDCTGNKHLSSCPHYQLSYTARIGLVVRVVEGKIEYTYESAQAVQAEKSGSSYSISVKPNAKTMVNGPVFVSSGGVSCSAGDIILIITGTNINNEAIVKDLVYVYAQSSTGNSGNPMAGGNKGGMSMGAMTGGMTGFGNSSTGTAVDEGLFDLEGQVLLTVIPHEEARLVISVDEHDIAKLAPGMKATVKVDALKDEAFPAEVTSIAVTGTNNGGSSKFSVELKLPMTADMLPGMSASAVINLEEKTDILLIPAAALVQKGARTLVYTALDEKGNPASPVEVTTGLSDGENVEILSGLKEGQKIYYSYYDTLELNTSAEASKYTLR